MTSTEKRFPTDAPRASCAFLNHAALKVTLNDFCLVVDPWLASDTFNRGWNLLYEDGQQNLGNLMPNAIWLSHEHPDHFNIPTLLQIPAEKRRSVTVYFRETRDRRVAKWCQENGFVVAECSDGQEIRLADDLYLKVFLNGIEDSAALLSVNGQKFLNLNDCLFYSEGNLRKFASKVGPVDYVGYLCGYAEGGGSRTDPKFRRALLEIQAKRFETLASVFPNAKVFGFAAFKFFSHEENFFQNDQIHFDWLERLLTERPETFGLVQPGDEIFELSPTQSRRALHFWRTRLETIYPVHTTRPGPDLQTLLVLANALSLKFRSVGFFPLWVTHLFPRRLGLRPLSFRLTDSGESINIGIRSRRRVNQGRSSHRDQILTSADALSHALSHEFGLSTLLINGRFEASDTARRNLYRWSIVGLLANSNQRIDFRFMIRNVKRIVKNI